MTDNRTTELLPCPFCGGEADEYEGDYGNGIYCMMCGAMVGEPIHLEYRTTKRVSMTEAIAAWNTRPKHVVGELVVNIHPMKKAPSINVLLAQFGYHYAATTSMIEMAALVDSYADRIREALCDD